MTSTTKIKFCGLTRPEDIAAANRILPEYIGFVFAPKSRRYITPERAEELRRMLAPGITAVGVFVDEDPAVIADLLNQGIIDMAQLHGREDECFIRRLRELTKKPILQAFRIRSGADAEAAESSSADCVLLDSGAGTGEVFDWERIRNMRRPYFLAGGLTPENASAAAELHPMALDVSSGIETEGIKDPRKMEAFAAAAGCSTKSCKRMFTRLRLVMQQSLH